MCVPTLKSAGKHTRQQTAHCGQVARDYQSSVHRVPCPALHPVMLHPAMPSPAATHTPQQLGSQSLACLQEADLLTIRLRSRVVS